MIRATVGYERISLLTRQQHGRTDHARRVFTKSRIGPVRDVTVTVLHGGLMTTVDLNANGKRRVRCEFRQRFENDRPVGVRRRKQTIRAYPR